MKNVCVIGAGQLGSRHLQALCGVKAPLNIVVVDPSDKALTTAQERFESINGEAHSVSYHQQIPNDIEKFHVAILASNSNVRRKIIESLVEKSSVEHLILEKVLFNRLQDYEVVEKIIDELQIKTVVNCPRRMVEFYQSAKSIFAGDPVTMHVSGSNFGLASNAIHFLDLLSYLVDCERFKVDTSSVSPNIGDSKREGFREFFGTLVASYEDGSTAILSCLKNGAQPIQVELVSGRARIIVQEQKRRAWVFREANGWDAEKFDFELPYQSQLTTTVVEDLLEKETCDLTSFEESSRMHRQYLSGLTFMLDSNSEIYPIT